MTDTAATPSEQDLRLFCELLERAGRNGGLSPDDVMDFTQSVQVRLLETNYALFRRFERQSSLKTYLTVVARRLLMDWKNHAWGKWRPSAVARRLGPHAVELERLVTRDGLNRSEAIHSVRCRPGAPPTRDLRQFVAQFPPRQERRCVSDDVLGEMAGPAFEDPLLARHQAAVDERRHRAVHELLARLPNDDRRLIEARYVEQVRVPALARALGQDAKIVYRRCERVLRALRRDLSNMGLGRSAACAAQSHPASECTSA